MKARQNKILLIDDDINLCTVVSHQLESIGHKVTIANSGNDGIEYFKNDGYDLLLIDIQMPDMSGMDVLQKVRTLDAEVSIIIITAYGTIENAIEACHIGADDYLTKPFPKEQLHFTIEKTLRLRTLEQDNQRLKKELSDRYTFGSIVTQDKNMSALLRLAGRAAQSDSSILLLGESGTGKELLAKAIHHNSPRNDKPFIAINCPSIPESLIESELFGHEKGAFTGAIQTRSGKFELAHGGTIFLDEIGDLKLDLQSRLLRVLQEHEFERIGGRQSIKIDVRVIAATNQDLTSLVKSRQFREDLYYRLNVIPLVLPPLRDRMQDIPLLVDNFITKYAKGAKKAHPSFLSLLMNNNWPGNIRELENVVQRAIVLCPGEELTQECLEMAPSMNDAGQKKPTTLEEAERHAIMAALKANDWNQTHAAEQLEIPRHRLLYRIKKLKIKRH